MLYMCCMKPNLLPEASRISPGTAIKLNVWAGVAVLVSFTSRWWLPHHPESGTLVRVVVALAPLVPSLLWARSIARWMRGLDELQRRIQQEAWFFAAMGTVFVVTALNLVESAGILHLGRLPHGLGWEGCFALMFLLYSTGCAISNRRYA